MAGRLSLSIRPSPFVSPASLCRLGRTIGHDILEILLVIIVADVRENLQYRVERFSADTQSASDVQEIHESKQPGDGADDAVSRFHVDFQKSRV
jgi:hypothetical protein